VIRSEHDAIEPEGSLFILKGSLAPAGAVVKASRVAKAMWRSTLSPRVFEDEESAIDAFRAGAIVAGFCVAARSEGTKGDPGIRKMPGCDLRSHGRGTWQELRPRGRGALLRRNPLPRQRLCHAGNRAGRCELGGERWAIRFRSTSPNANSPSRSSRRRLNVVERPMSRPNHA
jgi:hypothetical protein